MDFDFGAFFEDAGKKAQSALDDLTKVGVPGIEVAAQQWGIDTLKSMQAGSQKELTAAVKDVTANGNNSTLGNAFQATIQNTIFQSYGLYIVGGIAVLIVVGFALRGK